MNSNGPDSPQPTDRAGLTRLRATRRVTWAGIVTNLALAAVKVVAGWIGHSQALIADGIHSLSDLITDAVILLAARHAARGADRDHPYGHARIETAASVVVGALLIVTAIAIGRHAVASLGHTNGLARPVWITFAIALLSVIVKEILFRYTRRTARWIHSGMLDANAWHHRSDALSSIVVAIGLAGAIAGMVSLDAVAALVVAVMIAKVGGDVIWKSLRELVDTGLDPDALADLQTQAQSVNGVRRAHTFRSRWMGHRALLDLHIRVGSRISVSEGHRIAEAVRLQLLDHLHRLADVMVHVDPEDDTDGGPSNDLPMRDELCARLHERLPDDFDRDRIEGMTLHYLAARVHLELTLRPARATESGVNAEAVRAALVTDPAIGDISIHVRVAPATCDDPLAGTSKNHSNADEKR